jgi:hypothetical protein
MLSDHQVLDPFGTLRVEHPPLKGSRSTHPSLLEEEIFHRVKDSLSLSLEH